MMAGAKGMPQKDIREELKKTLAGILMTLNVLGEKRLEEWMKKELIKFEI
jgi:hypothetical protein